MKKIHTGKNLISDSYQERMSEPVAFLDILIIRFLCRAEHVIPFIVNACQRYGLFRTLFIKTKIIERITQTNHIFMR